MCVCCELPAKVYVCVNVAVCLLVPLCAICSPPWQWVSRQVA